MLLNRASPRNSSSPRQSLSMAQYQNAVRFPARRFTQPNMRFDTPYSLYDTTTSPRRSRRHSGDFMLPPVHMAPMRSFSSGRRSLKRGPRNLPRMNSPNSGTRALPWYHEDGTINLQALSHLANKQTFPRTQSYYDRLARLKTRPWSASDLAGHASTLDDGRLVLSQSSTFHDENPTPLKFVDDDLLTPRKRAERDSLLHLLLNSDDLTEEDLEQIAMYIVPDQSEEDSSPQSCLKIKSPRPESAKKKKARRHSDKENSGAKSVRFSQKSPSLSESAESSSSSRPQPSPRPQDPTSNHDCLSFQSSNVLTAVRRHSDPFHVASPLASPREPSSSDEVAYFRNTEFPLEVPASPEPIPEPKIVYYDESGEEIEEEIHMKNQACGENKEEDDTAGVDSSYSTTKSHSSQSSATLIEDVSDLPEHMPELDTPRVNRDPVDAHSSPPAPDSDDDADPSPQGHSLSESSDSLCSSPLPDAKKQAKEEIATQYETSSKDRKPHKETGHNSELPNDSSTPPPVTAPAEDSPRPSKKTKHKSSKRHKSRSKSSSSEKIDCHFNTDKQNDNSLQPEKTQEDTPVIQALEEETRSVEAEPQPIPVISLTRGQLSAVPPHSPRIQNPDSPSLRQDHTQTDSPCSQNSDKPSLGQDQTPTDSMCPEYSPRSSTLQGMESSATSPRTESKRRGKSKDNRMKVWLTRTSWDRHVECVD